MIHGSLHETTNKVVCAPIEESENPTPPPGFVRVKKPLVCPYIHLEISKGTPSFLQTVFMCE